MLLFFKKISSKIYKGFGSKTAILFVSLAGLWLLFGPFIIVKIIGENEKFCNVGQIGDTIGGITTPFLTFVSIVLLYITINKQVQAGKQTDFHLNYRVIDDAIRDYKKILIDFNQPIILDHINSIKIISTTHNGYLQNIGLDKYSERIDFFYKTHIKFFKLLSLYEELETSIPLKKVLYSEIRDLFNENFYNILHQMKSIEFDWFKKLSQEEINNHIVYIYLSNSYTQLLLFHHKIISGEVK